MALAFGIATFIFCFCVSIAFIYGVIFMVYNFAYFLWIGAMHSRGQYKNVGQEGESTRRAFRNATKLYAAWILRRKPNF